MLSDVRRILALVIMPIEEQGGLRSSRVCTSEWGRIIGSQWAGRAGAVALPRRRSVGESEFSAGIGWEQIGGVDQDHVRQIRGAAQALASN